MSYRLSTAYLKDEKVDKGKLPMTEGGRAALKSMLKFGLFNNK